MKKTKKKHTRRKHVRGKNDVKPNLNRQRPETEAGLFFSGREKSIFWYNCNNKTEKMRKSCDFRSLGDAEHWTETSVLIRSDQADHFQASPRRELKLILLFGRKGCSALLPAFVPASLLPVKPV